MCVFRHNSVYSWGWLTDKHGGRRLIWSHVNLTRLRQKGWIIRTQWSLPLSTSVYSLLHHQWVICFLGEYGKKGMFTYSCSGCCCYVLCVLAALSRQSSIQAGEKKVQFFLHLLKFISCSKTSKGGLCSSVDVSLCVVVLCMLWLSVERVQRHRWVSLGDTGGWRTMQGKQHLNLWDDRLSSCPLCPALYSFISPASVCISPMALNNCFLFTQPNNTYWYNQSYLWKVNLRWWKWVWVRGLPFLFSLSPWRKGLSPDQIFHMAFSV